MSVESVVCEKLLYYIVTGSSSPVETYTLWHWFVNGIVPFILNIRSILIINTHIIKISKPQLASTDTQYQAH